MMTLRATFSVGVSKVLSSALSATQRKLIQVLLDPRDKNRRGGKNTYQEKVKVSKRRNT